MLSQPLSDAITVFLKEFFLKMRQSHLLSLLTNSRKIKMKSQILDQLVFSCRESYSTQHVLIRLLEEWRENLDDNETVGRVSMVL